MKLKSLLLLFFLLSQAVWAQDPSSWGQKGNDILLVGGKIMVSPGQTISKGNLHVVDGRIAAVGEQVTGPSRSRKIDVSGLVIHPGVIDPYVQADRVGLEEKERTAAPVTGSHPKSHDDFRVVDALELSSDVLSPFRKLGFVAVAVVPNKGILRGQAAVYRTGSPDQDSQLLVNPSVYSAVRFETLGWDALDGENYPLSLMGCVAFIRQTFLEAKWYSSARSVPGYAGSPPPYSPNLESLEEILDGKRLMVGEAANYLDTLRFLSLFQEIGVPRSAVVLSGQEWMELSWFKSASRVGERFILPLAFPADPKDGDGVSREQITLDVLRRWFAAPANARWLRALGFNFSLTTHGQRSIGDFPGHLQEALQAGLSHRDALASLTTEPAELLGIESDFGTLQAGKSASFVIRDGGPFSGRTVVREVWVEGVRYPDYDSIAKGIELEPKLVKTRPFVKDADYTQPPEILTYPYSPSSVLVKNATIWTQDSAGILRGADMLVQDGVIRALGKGLTAPAGAHVIDAKGYHVTPGLIDAHSHSAIQGMVNEPGANITAMVRTKDVIDPFDHDIYLQLASGVTTANILHGSANAIGGQSVTCKWRLGSAPSEMVFKSAPEGIKFALGENPKQSNWGDQHQTRYPQSRMGVIELIRGAFVSAQNYRRLKAEGKNPKPDLALEALLEVLDGERILHCHCYRQDEILALIRTAEEVGFKVDVFQHVLEGYKVADQIARHGAAASTFADWWAYKVEVEDAIPQNAALLAEAGVVVSVNSDSNDLARRLNTEAAKSIRYGGISEVEALNLITRNAAVQLGVVERTGTLTVGKDGDFVVWSDNPLKQNAVALETWIEGKGYFHWSLENDAVSRLTLERNRYLKLLTKNSEVKS